MQRYIKNWNPLDTAIYYVEIFAIKIQTICVIIFANIRIPPAGRISGPGGSWTSREHTFARNASLVWYP